MSWQSKSFKSLKASLDRYFSKFIRLRDTKDGLGWCITCARLFLYRQLDAGHFQTRDNLSIRWNEQNVNAQCQGCNRFKGGRQYEHGIAIDKKYGKGTAEMLLIKSKSIWKPTRFELNLLILEYKSKIKDYDKIQG